MTTGQKEISKNKTGTKTSVLPQVRYHPSIQNPANHPAKRPAKHPVSHTRNSTKSSKTLHDKSEPNGLKCGGEEPQRLAENTRQDLKSENFGAFDGTYIETVAKNSGNKILILPQVEDHPSIRTPSPQKSELQKTRNCRNCVQMSSRSSKSVKSGARTEPKRDSKTQNSGKKIIPQVWYHPSIKISQVTEGTVVSTSSQEMDQSKRTDEVKDQEGGAARSAPGGGARVQDGRSDGATQNGRQRQGANETGKTSQQNCDGTPKGTSKNTGPEEGGGDCEIGPKDEPLNGEKMDSTKTRFSGEDSNQFSQVQARKETRKNMKKLRNVTFRVTDEALCGADGGIGSNDEQTDRAKVENQTSTSVSSDGGDANATGDSAGKGARKKSKKLNQISGNDQEFQSPEPGPAVDRAMDLDLLQSRSGSSLDQVLVEQVEVRTRGQRKNPDWFRFRKNRITASVAHSIAHCKFVNGKSTSPPESYVKTVLGESCRVETRAMTWGIDHEEEAVLKYQAWQSAALARPLRVQDCGLFIDAARPWLAASPDGIVTDAETGQWLRCLEVKCPFKHRARSVETAVKSDHTFCLELSDQEGAQQFSLKRTHPYFTQVQCQLAVTGLKMADFVVFTETDLAVVQVQFDPDFWDQTVSKLERFYSEAVVPVLRKRNPAWHPEI